MSDKFLEKYTFIILLPWHIMTPGYWDIWTENSRAQISIQFSPFGAGCYAPIQHPFGSDPPATWGSSPKSLLLPKMWPSPLWGKTQTTLSGPLGEEHVFASRRHEVLRKMDSDLQEQNWYWKLRDNIFLESTFIWLSKATSVHAEKIKGRPFSWLHFSSLVNHQPLLFTFEIVHRYGGSPLLVPEIVGFTLKRTIYIKCWLLVVRSSGQYTFHNIWRRITKLRYACSKYVHATNSSDCSFPLSHSITPQ